MTTRLEAVHPVLSVQNVTASVQFYERLGFALAFRDSPDDPKYAGIRRDGVEVHLQWHDPREWEVAIDRPVLRFVVADVDELSREFDSTGLTLHRTKVWDTQWGTREFHVLDPDRNGLQFYRDR